MSKPYLTDQLRQLLDKSQTVLVALPENPRLDTLAAGLVLYFGLQKLQKQAAIFSPSPITAEHNRLIGIDQVKQSIANRNLVISWPHQSFKVERAYTEIDQQQDRFQIVIEPQEDGAMIDHEQINYGYSGVSGDMIVFVGARYPDELAHLKSDIDPIIDSMHVVRMDIQPHDPHPRSVDYFDDQVSSISELVYHVLSGLEVAFDPDMATNILSGIEHQTQLLSDPNMSPDTFEAIAACMRLGGKRGYIEPDYSEVDNDAVSQTNEVENEDVEVHEQFNQPIPETKKQATPGWLVPKILRSAKTA